MLISTSTCWVVAETDTQSNIFDSSASKRDFNDALFHLNSLDKGRALDCRQILDRYGSAVNLAVETIMAEKDVQIQPEWVLAIIKQETSGIAHYRNGYVYERLFHQLQQGRPEMGGMDRLDP